MSNSNPERDSVMEVIKVQLFLNNERAAKISYTLN